MISSKSSNDSILEELMKRVRQRRLNLNMTQEQLANITGLHIQTIKNFESGNCTNYPKVLPPLRF